MHGRCASNLTGRSGNILISKFNQLLFINTRPSAPSGRLVLGGDARTFQQNARTKSLELFRLDVSNLSYYFETGNIFCVIPDTKNKNCMVHADC